MKSLTDHIVICVPTVSNSRTVSFYDIRSSFSICACMCVLCPPGPFEFAEHLLFAFNMIDAPEKRAGISAAISRYVYRRFVVGIRNHIRLRNSDKTMSFSYFFIQNRHSRMFNFVSDLKVVITRTHTPLNFVASQITRLAPRRFPTPHKIITPKNKCPLTASLFRARP